MPSTRITSVVLIVLALGVTGPGFVSAGSRPHPRVVMKKARAIALAKVPGGRIQAAELEREHGTLLYSFDIRVPHKPGIEEVHVDAMSGAVIGIAHESPKAERDEAKQENRTR